MGRSRSPARHAQEWYQTFREFDEGGQRELAKSHPPPASGTGFVPSGDRSLEVVLATAEKDEGAGATKTL